jgi:hypothetical protein
VIFFLGLLADNIAPWVLNKIVVVDIFVASMCRASGANGAEFLLDSRIGCPQRQAFGFVALAYYSQIPYTIVTLLQVLDLILLCFVL